MYLDPGCCPAWSGPQAGHLQVYYFLFLLDSRDRRRRSKLSFLYMERVKVDGVRIRPKNKLDPSKDDSFSTGKRNEAGRKLCVRSDCLLQLFRKLEGVGRDKRKEGETETKFFSLTYV